MLPWLMHVLYDSYNFSLSLTFVVLFLELEILSFTLFSIAQNLIREAELLVFFYEFDLYFCISSSLKLPIFCSFSLARHMAVTLGPLLPVPLLRHWLPGSGFPLSWFAASCLFVLGACKHVVLELSF